jgi:BRCT domain type II-containing protein
MSSYNLCNTAVVKSFSKLKNIKKTKFKNIHYSTQKGWHRDKRTNNGDTNVIKKARRKKQSRENKMHRQNGNKKRGTDYINEER